VQRPRTLASRAGFTVVELVIAVALLVLLFSSAVLAARGGMGAFRATQEASEVEARVRRALDRAAFELLCAAASELLPNPTGDFGTSSLQFARTTGLNGTVRVLADPDRLAFEYESGETDNGLDDDGNGLVDDGVLVLTRDVGGAAQRVILCHGVSERLEGEAANGADDNGNDVIDEAGFNVRRVGTVLYLRLSLEAAGENSTIVRTLETSVRLRN